MRFARDNPVEIGGGKKLLIFVVEEEGLNRGDDDSGASPVLAVLCEEGRLVVGGEKRSKGILGLILQFEAIHQKENASGVARTEKELNNRSEERRGGREGRCRWGP